MRVVVIGVGYIGLEATENFREMGTAVTVVEALPEILPWLPETLRARVVDEAKAHGVEMLVGTRVEAIERTGSCTAVETSDATLEADLVLVATGVRPESELASAAGLALGAAGSIAVDDYLRTSDEHIYAAGDCVDASHAITSESVWFPLALRGNRAGKLAGDNVFGHQRPAPPVLGTAVFKFFGLEAARRAVERGGRGGRIRHRNDRDRRLEPCRLLVRRRHALGLADRGARDAQAARLLHGRPRGGGAQDRHRRGGDPRRHDRGANLRHGPGLCAAVRSLLVAVADRRFTVEQGARLRTRPVATASSRVRNRRPAP